MNASPARWTVVIPVKAPARAKTRLAPHLDAPSRQALARAFAADTVEAALAARSVARVVVVGDDPSLAGAAEFLDERSHEDDNGALSRVEGPQSRPRGDRQARSCPRGDDQRGGGVGGAGGGGGAGGAGLTGAILAGVGHARRTGGGDVAVLLGDLPCLRPDDLDAALALAARHPLTFVADADGTGTTLATALAGVGFAPRFGPDSAEQHRLAGFVPLEASVRLRRDVDTIAALEDAIVLGTGAHTARVVSTLADRGPDVGGL